MKNGKGSSPRNLSKRFRENYDCIKWKSKAMREYKRAIRSQIRILNKIGKLITKPK